MIGGGVGGLSCARRLAQHGIETVAARGRHRGGRRERAQRRLPDRGRRPPSTTTRASASAPSGRARCTRRTLEAQREVDRARRGARRGRRAPAGRPDPAGRVRGGGRARARPRRRPPRGRLPGRDRRARGPAARAAAQRARGLPDRRTTAPSTRRAGIACWRRAAERAGARIYEGTRVSGPVAAPGEGPVTHSDAAASRARARGRGRRRRAAGARARVRGPRALAAAAHGRHRAGSAGDRHDGLRPLGLRVPPAAPGRAHPGRAASATWTPTTRTRTATPAAR